MDDGNNILRGNAVNPEAHTVFLTWRSLRLFSLLFEGFSYFIVGKVGRDVPSDEIIVLRALSLTLKVGSDSAFQSPPIFGDFPFPPPFFPFFSVIFSCGHALQ